MEKTFDPTVSSWSCQSPVYPKKESTLVQGGRVGGHTETSGVYFSLTSLRALFRRIS
jgi:hypothetical protein